MIFSWLQSQKPGGMITISDEILVSEQENMIESKDTIHWQIICKGEYTQVNLWG